METPNISMAQYAGFSATSGDKGALMLISNWMTSEELFEVAGKQLSQLIERWKKDPDEFSALYDDLDYGERGIEQLLQLFDRFCRQAEAWQRNAELPLTLPAGTSSRALGVKLAASALKSYEQAIAAIDLIPAQRLTAYVELRLQEMDEHERVLERRLLAGGDPRCRVELEEVRNYKLFCLKADAAAVQLRVSAAELCLKLAQLTAKTNSDDYLAKAGRLLKEAQVLRPEIGEQPAFQCAEANVPVLRYLLS